MIGSYEVKSILGKGGFATVYEVCRTGQSKGTIFKTPMPKRFFDTGVVNELFVSLKWIMSETRYALKKMHHLTDKLIMTAKKETAILASLKHTNIIKHIESFEYMNGFYMVMEIANRGDLSKLIAQRKHKGMPWSKEFILDAMLQIVSGLNHAHEQKTMHRDLKPQNVLVHCVDRSDWHPLQILKFQKYDDWEEFPGAIVPKISDFGLAKVTETSHDYASTVCGTKLYMSAEAHDGHYDFSSDVWSVGCILYELCMLKRLFTKEKFFSLIYKNTKDIPRICVTSNSGEDWRDLSNLCTN